MLKSYANYFVAYLLSNLNNLDDINRIVLYGSVAKNEATKNSDVDIFIETNKKTKKFEEKIKNIEEKFYESREAVLFKSKNVENKLSIKIGKLKDWRELYKEVASTGIILYGPYEAKELPSGVKHFIIIYWESIESNRGAFLNKIYGFKIKNKHYSGLLEKFNGKRLGKSCIIIPIEYKNEIFNLLTKHKVKAKSLGVFV